MFSYLAGYTDASKQIRFSIKALGWAKAKRLLKRRISRWITGRLPEDIADYSCGFIDAHLDSLN